MRMTKACYAKNARRREERGEKQVHGVNKMPVLCVLRAQFFASFALQLLQLKLMLIGIIIYKTSPNFFKAYIFDHSDSANCFRISSKSSPRTASG